MSSTFNSLSVIFTRSQGQSENRARTQESEAPTPPVEATASLPVSRYDASDLDFYDPDFYGPHSYKTRWLIRSLKCPLLGISSSGL